MDRHWFEELEERAHAVLPPEVHRYVRQGAGASLSAGEARAAWERVRFVPHVLRDVSTVELGAWLLGTRVSVPFGIAPTSLQRAAHPEGEVAMARASAEVDALMVVSSNAGSPFAEIAATGVTWWLQVYLPRDRSLAEPLLHRAVAAGARAIVLTVDTPVVGTKLEDGPSVWETVDPDWVQVNFDDGYDDLPGSEKATDLGPADIEWLGRVTGLPVVVKGVLRSDDARTCVEAGAAAVWVSNHGGRQLDRARTTVDALPAVVAAVPSATEVYVDGGLHNGTDLLAAHALGARAAFLGRLPLWALASGEATVTAVLRELSTQLSEAMRLAGARDLSEVPAILAPQPEKWV